MKLLLTILASFFLVGMLSAQTGQGEIENWVEARSICAEAGRELIEVSVSDAITEIIISPSDPLAPALAWYVGEAKTWRFWIDSTSSDYVSITAFVGGMGFSVDEIFLGNKQDCDSASGDRMNECLGMSRDDFVQRINYLPIEEGFVVDGAFYHYHGNLSFLVPTSARWTWDLYADGRHVLRFEQTEAMPCTVTEVYPQ